MGGLSWLYYDSISMQKESIIMVVKVMDNINIEFITDLLHAIDHLLSIWVVVLTLDRLMLSTLEST